MAALNGESVDGSQTAIDIRAIVDSIKIEHAVDSNFQFKDLTTGGSSQHRRRLILGISSQFFQQIGSCFSSPLQLCSSHLSGRKHCFLIPAPP